MTMQRPYYGYITVEDKVEWWPIMNMLTQLACFIKTVNFLTNGAILTF